MRVRLNASTLLASFGLFAGALFAHANLDRIGHPLDAAPLFNVVPSTPDLVQGQSLSLYVSPTGGYPNLNLELGASVDGGTATVVSAGFHAWIVTVSPFGSTGTHHLSLSLALEDSESSARISSSITRENSRIVELQNEIQQETDLNIVAKLRRDLQAQESIRATLVSQIAELRMSAGTQDYAFEVGPDTVSSSFPSISTISPNVGPFDGSVQLVISGSNFVNGATVKVGGLAATNVSVVNSTSLLATLPQLPVLGANDVEVDLPSLPDGEIPKAMLAGGFFATPHTSPTTNTPPVAITGGSQVVSLGQSAVLDGSESFDWGGGNISYRWTFLATPANSAMHPGDLLGVTSKPVLTPDAYGTYVVQLVVSQTFGAFLSSQRSLAVVQTAGGAPSLNAPVIAAVSGVAATSQISVQDPSNVAESYAIAVAPTHGTATVNSFGLVTYTSDPAYVGPDSIQVKVTNQYGLSSTVTIQVVVQASKGLAIQKFN